MKHMRLALASIARLGRRAQALITKIQAWLWPRLVVAVRWLLFHTESRKLLLRALAASPPTQRIWALSQRALPRLTATCQRIAVACWSIARLLEHARRHPDWRPAWSGPVEHHLN